MDEHRAFLKEVDEYLAVREPGQSECLAVRRFLTAWVDQHLGYTDGLFREYLAENRA